MAFSFLPEQSVSDILSFSVLKFGTEGRIAALKDGKIAVTWSEPAGDKNIHVRLFSATGEPLGESRIVNPSATAAHGDSQITALSDGGFLVSWSREVLNGEDNVWARAYTAEGVARSDAFLVSPDGGNVTPTNDDDRHGDVQGLSGGGAVFVWEARGTNDLHGRVLAPDGETLGDPVLLNSAGGDRRVVQLANGDVLVLLSSTTNTGVDIRLSGPDLTSAPQGVPDAKGPVVLGIDLTPGTEERIATQAPDFIKPLTSGGFVMGYRHDPDIRYDTPVDTFRLDWFDASGTRTKRSDIAIPAVDEAVDASWGQAIPVSGDRVLLIWQIYTATDGYDLMAQMVSADGTLGQAERLTVHKSGNQLLLEATVLENGNVAVVFSDASGSAVEGGIDPLHLRVIDLAGGSQPSDRPTQGADILVGTKRNNTIDALGGDDDVRGLGGNDRLIGNAGADTLRGDAGNDTLIGGAGDDVLEGSAGRDRLTGGDGADDFVFHSPRDTGRTAASRDTITDFARKVDRIDLSAMDATTGESGDQAFTFIGKRAFSEAAGQLRFANGLLSGDVDGDGRADFTIAVSGLRALASEDFIL